MQNNLSVTICYVNQKRKLQGILKTTVELSETAELAKNKLVKLIGTYNNYSHKSYVILDAFKYHVNLNSMDHCKMVVKKGEDGWMEDFVSKGWQYSDDMAWTSTMAPFQPLNSLVLLFIEKPSASSLKTKRQRKNVVVVPNQNKSKRVVPFHLN
jgi:hypothetical protein